MTPAVSVVVCTYNRKDKLEKLLLALDAQTIRRDMELIVVDDCSDAPVAGIAERHGAVFLRHRCNKGPGAARNTGISVASAPIVAFTDDDCVPEPDWAAGLCAPYRDPSVVGVGGPVRVLRPEDALVRRYYAERMPLAPLEIELERSHSLPYRALLYLRDNMRPRTREGDREVFSLAGANCSFRRDALEKIGGFDAGVAFAGEDEDLCRRIRAAHPHLRLWFTEAAPVWHDFDPSVRDLVRRARSYGLGSARNCAKHPEWRPGVFPAPILFALIMARAVHQPIWALAGAALPLVFFPRWAKAAAGTLSPEPLIYAYLQLLEEAATDVGFLLGRRGGPRPVVGGET